MENVKRGICQVFRKDGRDLAIYFILIFITLSGYGTRGLTREASWEGMTIVLCMGLVGILTLFRKTHHLVLDLGGKQQIGLVC